jgi:hypothetical protein
VCVARQHVAKPVLVTSEPLRIKHVARL